MVINLKTAVFRKTRLKFHDLGSLIKVTIGRSIRRAIQTIALDVKDKF